MPYNYPSGMIAPFDAACPSGWTRVSTWDNKFLMGGATYGTIGGYANHVHSCNPGIYYSQSTSAGDQSVGGLDDACSTASHFHSVVLAATDTSSANNEPPYINVVFCKKD